MKKFITIMLLAALPTYGQQSAASGYTEIPPEPLAIAVGKTTHLIYPYAIKSVDRGNRDVLVQKAKGLDNILQVKAGRECFEATNLTVITTDGKLYSYSVSYNEDTNQLNLDYTDGATNATAAYNPSRVKELSASAAILERNTYGLTDRNDGVRLRVEGIYVCENLFFFKIRMSNDTNINYDIGQLRLFIKDRQVAKRTAAQENEIRQVYVHNAFTVLRGQQAHVFVIAVPKFTIPDKKQVVVQVMELDGGRHLELALTNKNIVKAEPIP